MGEHAYDSFAPIYTGFKARVRESYVFNHARQIIAAIEAIAECCSPLGVTYISVRGIMERGWMGEGAAKAALAALIEMDAVRFFYTDNPATRERMARMIVSPMVLHIRETMRDEALKIWNNADCAPIGNWARALKNSRNTEFNGHPEVVSSEASSEASSKAPKTSIQNNQPDTSIRLKNTTATATATAGAANSVANNSAANSSAASSAANSSSAKTALNAPPNPPLPPLSPQRRDELIDALHRLGTSRNAATTYVDDLGEYVQHGIVVLYAQNAPVRNRVGFVVAAARAARDAKRPAKPADDDVSDYLTGKYAAIFDYPAVTKEEV